MFRYFISYQIQDGNIQGFGNAEISIPFKIINMKGIQKVTSKLEKDLNYTKGSLVIINFMVFAE